MSSFLYSRACPIPDPDNEEVIITGGYHAMKIVSVYSKAGWQRDLTSLNQGRRYHACGSYVNGGKKVNQINRIYAFGAASNIHNIYY